jgi:hypothetical protein
MFEQQGYELIHMSAPSKGTTADQYIGEMVDLLTSLSGQNVIMDRSHYGERCWPMVYGREPLISEDDMEMLREIESNMDVTRILMHDPNSEAHWQRCVDNKEPLTKIQFVKARALYSNMADKYGFERKTLKDFPDAIQPLPEANGKDSKPVDSRQEAADAAQEVKRNSDKTKEQLKLERANVINEVLDKRIIRGKGPIYDDVERSVRHFLNTELGKILGTATSVPNLSNDEIELLKFFCKRLKEKETE